MKRGSSRLFSLELGAAFLGVVFALLTVVWNDWIEIVFNADPDRGSGSLEWMIVATCIVATATFALLARTEWRKTMSLPA